MAAVASEYFFAQAPWEEQLLVRVWQVLREGKHWGRMPGTALRVELDLVKGVRGVSDLEEDWRWGDSRGASFCGRPGARRLWRAEWGAVVGRV